MVIIFTSITPFSETFKVIIKSSESTHLGGEKGGDICMLKVKGSWFVQIQLQNWRGGLGISLSLLMQLETEITVSVGLGMQDFFFCLNQESLVAALT